jgi:uncharacterized protein YxjI
MRERMVSIGDDFWIEDAQGNRAYKVDGKALRVRNTPHFEDRQGNRLASIQERKARVRDAMKIEARDGSTIATVKKAMVTPIRERYRVSVPGGDDLDVRGNIVDHPDRCVRVGPRSSTARLVAWFPSVRSRLA